MNQSSQISALAVMAESGLFPSEKKKAKETPNFVAFATRDGNIKVTEWNLTDFGNAAVGEKPRTPFIREQLLEYTITGDSGLTYITTMLMAEGKAFLIAGTSNGDVRLYKWNPTPDPDQSTAEPVFIEKKAHSTAVICVRQTPDGSIISVGEDGTIFIWNIERIEADTDSLNNGSQFQESVMSELDVDEWTYNDSIVFLSTSDVDKQMNKMDDLYKELNETKDVLQFKIRMLEDEHAERVRKIVQDNSTSMSTLRNKYDSLLADHTQKMKEVQRNDEAKDIEHVKIVVDLENKFERKLSEQLERYDALSEEMELMVQRNKVFREQQDREHKQKVAEMARNIELLIKKNKEDMDRAKAEQEAEKNLFKETLSQQEEEYEEELKNLIAVSAHKLKEEKEAHDAIRELTKSKLAKTKNIAEKLKESNLAKTAIEVKQHHDKMKIQKLHDTIDHYKKNLSEREEALAEKEKVILDLRNTTKTLENFRFVLDHRLQQLTAERGPITSHIEGLERHVTAMYEELVNEFENKKNMQVQVEQKEQKIAIASSEATKVRVELKQKDDFIAAFKRELSNAVSAPSGSKELEEATKLLYRKYVIGDSLATVKTNSGIGHMARDLMADNDDDDDDEEENDVYFGQDAHVTKGRQISMH